VVFGPEGHLYVSSWSGDDVRRFDGTTGAYIDTYVSTNVRTPGYHTFIPGHQVRVLP